MKPLLLVDGYNIIGAWSEAQKGDWTLEESRDRLAHLLEDYAGYTGQEVVLVFDGHHSDRPLRSVDEKAALTLVYTKHGETADQYIERTCAQLPVYREARVATSDQLEQTIILGRGATRVSARELLAELRRQREGGTRHHRQGGAAMRNPLFSSLTDEQREQLEQLHRQK